MSDLPLLPPPPLCRRPPLPGRLLEAALRDSWERFHGSQILHSRRHARQTVGFAGLAWPARFCVRTRKVCGVGADLHRIYPFDEVGGF